MFFKIKKVSSYFENNMTIFYAIYNSNSFKLNLIVYTFLQLLFLYSFRSAEVDATTAIQLDKNYVKAYQRRGFARLELGQLAEAKSDFEEVLKVEPKSSLMRLEVNKINEKLNKTLKSSNSKIIFNHKNIFKEEKKEVPKKSVNTSKNNSLDKVVGIKASDGSVKNPIESSAKLKNQTESAKTEGQLQTCRNGNKKLDGTKNRGDGDKEVSPDLGKEEPSVFKELQEHCRIVHPIQIPPHKRSKVFNSFIYIFIKGSEILHFF